MDGGNRFVDLQFMKAGTADALVLAGISKQAFNLPEPIAYALGGICFLVALVWFVLWYRKETKTSNS